MLVLFLPLLAAAALYFYLRHVYSYWTRHGFAHLEPSIPVGNLGLVVRRETSFGLCLFDLYKRTTEPFVGIYMLFKPVLLVRDASLARQMLSTDFNSFHDRGVYCNPKYDPLSENLFAMTGPRWRTLRAKLSPSFTSGKLRNMLSTIAVESDRLQAYMADRAASQEVVEMKDLLSRYSLNVIGSVIFGVDADTISDPKHPFRTIEKRIVNGDLVNVIKSACVFLCPKVLQFFRANSMPADVQQFMIDVVQQQIEHREKNNITRKDMIQFLIQLRNTGTINTDDSVWDVETTATALKNMSIEQCAAQVFLFYVAGFDSTSSTTAFTLFELARNRAIYQRLQAEIDETLTRHDGQLTYECVQEMQYLDMCVMETIRKYPALPILNRECTDDYALPNGLVLKKGTGIVISLLGIARDAQYFPDPLLYRPDRYSEAERAQHSDAYMPFGEGPRACIGVRLGKMVVKMAIVQLLQKYDFHPTGADKELEFDNFAVTLQVRGGINLRVTKREQ